MTMRWTLRTTGIIELSMGILWIMLSVFFLVNAQRALHPPQPRFEAGLPEAGAQFYVSNFLFFIIWGALPILSGLLTLSKKLWLISLVSSILFLLPYVVVWSIICNFIFLPLVSVPDAKTLTMRWNLWAFFLVEAPVWLAGVALAGNPIILIGRSRRQFGGTLRFRRGLPADRLDSKSG